MTRHLLIAGAAIAALSLAACGQPADQSATAPAESVTPDANPTATVPTMACLLYTSPSPRDRG